MKDCNLPAPNSKFRVAHVDGDYVVLNGDGVCVFGPNNKDIADAKCDALQAAADSQSKRGLRACLCCRAEFLSEGIHNRMCNACRRISDPLGSTGFAGGQDGRKPRRAARV
ncbi:hypothetical protein [Pararhodobacter sp.]|uniref:hypothetical protein n=1 Tax=Pararhodobacter sp. TaxID=2127056 RepID=UPI002AFEA943|nr:hypothetical protein [Pararhodobacter sp.]